jgi:hypothetical protein
MSRRFLIIIATLALGLSATAGAVTATEPAVDPDAAVGIENVVPAPTDGGATPIEPDPSVTDPRPHSWDSILVGSDGRTLAIYFWMGIEACNGLHSVTVSPSGSGIDVQLLSGQPSGMARDTACIEIAQRYVTTVTLEEPLITQAGQ